MPTNIAPWHEQFALWADIDIDGVADEAFHSLTIGGEQVPPEAKDASAIWFSMLSKEQGSKESLAVLRELLVNQLTIGARFCKVWTDPAPGTDELISAWTAQVEATERWQLFINAYNESADLELAHRLAFKVHHPQELRFGSDEDRTHWISMLVNEQQRFIIRNKGQESRQAEPTCILKDDALYYRGERHHLPSSLMSVLTKLWDTQPHSAEAIIRETIGSVPSKDQTLALSKRINKLNSELNKIWGPPPEEAKKWVKRVSTNNGIAYRLLTTSPNTAK